MMKTVVLLCVIVAAVVVSQGYVIQDSSRANLNNGTAVAGERNLYRRNVVRYAVANSVQSEDVVYRGNQTTRISRIQAYEVGATQNASARIISGGVGMNNVTIRFTSARGRGYNYQLNIFGR